jgi:predicted acetyltransferase
MTEESLAIRVGKPDDWDNISHLLTTVFHGTVDEELREIEGGTFEPERALIAADAGTIVGHAAAFTRELSVPGAVIPAAHVTMVGVAATHRRRGLLTRLMRRQLREIFDAGREPIAVLWASEGRIYPRFGYGLAAQRLRLRMDTREVRLAGPAGPDAGALRAGPPAALQVELAKLYEHLRPERPGWSSRYESTWRYVLADTPSLREGATERRAVVYEGPDGVDGYALWRGKSSWDDSGPNGEVIVNELAAATPEAYQALWRFLLSIDLTRTVHFWAAAVDEPLLHLVDEPRRLNPVLADTLWVRVVNVGAALAHRRYAAPVDRVIEVTDPLLPGNDGRWRLTADPTGASCSRTDAPADLACSVNDLGAVFLGGVSVAALAAAGRVRELRPGAVGEASAAFGWHRAPAAPAVF